MEKNYAFRQRLLEVHPKNIRDNAVWESREGCVVDDSWEIIVPAGASRLSCYVGRDLCDFFGTALEVYPRFRKARDIAGELQQPKHKIFLLTADIYPAPVESGQKMAYHLTVAEDSVIVCGKTDRGTAQGSYRLEEIMRQNAGPVIQLQDGEHAPLFSPRMTHSGYQLDTFPDQYMQAIAHAGMDAIIVFASNIDTCVHGYPDPDAVWKGAGRGYCDFNNLVYRAAGYGLDVYIYSRYACDLHPDDPAAREYYEHSFGRLFAHCPGLKGIIFVGETFEFPSKDPHTIGKRCQLRTPEDKGCDVGWYPCCDYPQLVSLVRDVIRDKNPDADIVFWSYNWGSKPKDARLELIRNLPRDISLLVTFDMFERFKAEDGAEYGIDDYSISFAGPGQYFTSEAEEAKRLGIRLYAMVNTGGKTWDIGVVPYLPVPYQWTERYRKIIEAHKNYDLAGLMENHHYGWLPSFIAELAKNAYWSDPVELEKKIALIAERDFGAGAADALAAWKCFSQGIRLVIAAWIDQYGPYRIGPAYPLVMDQTDVCLPPDPAGLHKECHITILIYSENAVDEPRLAILGLQRAKQVCALYAAGNKLLAAAVKPLEGSRAESAARHVALCKFLENTYRTTAHLKQWNMLKCMLVNLASDAPRDAALLWDEIGSLVAEKSAAGIAGAMKNVAEAEIANAAATAGCTGVDSAIGYEPTMEYKADPLNLDWKIGVTRESVSRLDKFMRDHKFADVK